MNTELLIFYSFFVFFFGLALGSYFSVVIWRVPRGESVIKPGSHCPSCNVPIKWYDNIPLVSYFLFFHGKCRVCKSEVAITYPLFEFLSGLLALSGWWCGIYWGNMHPVQSVGLAWLVVSCLPICIVDIKHYLIPDAVVVPGMVLGIVIAVAGDVLALDELNHAIDWFGTVNSILGFVAGGLGFWLFGKLMSMILRKESLGFGDVKYLAMAGAFLGPVMVWVVLVVAAVVGLVVTLGVRVFTRKGRDIPLPFGPYLAVGTVCVYFDGKAIVSWYLNFLEMMI